MPLATLNGFDIISGKIWLPLLGAWHADFIVDSSTAPTGRATFIADGGLRLVGTTVRTGAYLETTYLRMAAGNDGLRKTTTPKFYTAASVNLVLRDLLASAGETLAATADPKVLGTRLAGWTTVQQSIGSAIGVLLARGAPAGTSWRMLADGTLWIGAETWPSSGLSEPSDFVEMLDHPHEGRVDLGVDTPLLLPGTTLGDRRVSFVEHTLKDGEVRTRAMLV